MAKSKDKGGASGGRDQKKKPQKTIKEKRAAKQQRSASGSKSQQGPRPPTST